jgi:plastocyanin
MRKTLLLLVAALGLVAAGVAFAAVTRVVAIKAGGFSPVSRTIQTGDSIRWRNDDTVNHQVVADNGSFASPVLRPKGTYTKTFTTSGTYRYRDALEPAERGTIVVQGPPPSVSIAASLPTVFYGGEGVRLAGTISSQAANQDVSVWAQPYGLTSFVKVADLKTAAAGAWDWSTTPSVLTSYQARWGSRTSLTVQVGVRPRLTLIRRAPWFVTSAKAGRSLAGHWVYIQRKSALGQWVNIKKVQLGSTGAKRFQLKLPRGRSLLRSFLTTNQAGTGYLWSNSRSLVVRQRTTR